MCPSAPRVCSEPGDQKPELSLSLDLISIGLSAKGFHVVSSLGVLTLWGTATLKYGSCLVQVMACLVPSNYMMSSSNGSIFRVTGPLCGEFTGPGEFPAQRPVTRSFDVFFDLRPYKRLSKQPRGWWFQTPSWSLWRQCNVPEPVSIYCLSDFWERIIPIVWPATHESHQN